MSEKNISCCVCAADKNVVVPLPVNSVTLAKWAELLENELIKTDSRKKKMCIYHFDEKWHASLLNPACKRSPFCAPTKNPDANNIQDVETVETDNGNQKNQMNTLYMPDENTLHNRCKKQVNMDAAIEMKNSQIESLTEKVKRQQQQISELQKTIKGKRTVSEICENLKLGSNVRAMINLLVSTNERPVYSKDEISLCRSIYFKSTAAYSNLRELLDKKLPSIRSLLRWHDLKEFNVGLVQPVLNYLIQKRAELNDEDSEIILILDEMDGRRDLVFDPTRDEIIGFEDLFERAPKLAKKFLSVIVRGVNTKIENLILANFATANGIIGILCLYFKIHFHQRIVSVNCVRNMS